MLVGSESFFYKMTTIIFVTLCFVLAANSLPVEFTSSEDKNTLNVLAKTVQEETPVVRQKRYYYRKWNILVVS